MSPNVPAPSGKPEPGGALAPPFAGLPLAFVGSFPDPAHPLDPVLPEVAFVGRSNVGKSSLLNALVGRAGLARVSGTPGKTQLMNVFQLPTFYLVDLPGYGFARASKTARKEFRRLLETYLTRRPTLAGVVWLLDIRHPPSEDDRTVQQLLIESNRPTLAVLTKGDKLPRGQRARAADERARDLDLPADQLLATSAKTGEGIAELGGSILAAVSA